MKLAAMWLPLACAVGSAGVSAALLDDLGVEYTYDDNITSGELDRDVKSEQLLTLSATGGPRVQLTDRDSLALTANLAASVHRRYDGLDNAAAGLTLTWRRKTGLGPYVPQLAFGVGATRRDYRDGLRDSWIFSAEAEASKRITERTSLRATLRHEHRKADDTADRVVPFIRGDVFDLTGNSLGLAGEYASGERYVVSAGYTLHRGDIVSTTLRNFPVFLASRSIAPDPTFGDDRFAYTLRALTHVLRLGVTREIGHQASLSLGYEYRDSRADGGIDYRGNVLRATYLYDF